MDTTRMRHRWEQSISAASPAAGGHGIEHPFYGPSARLLAGRGSEAAGLLTMAACLLFWAGVVGIGLKMARDRFPRPSQHPEAGLADGVPDPAVSVMRQRYAAGESTATSSCRGCGPGQLARTQSAERWAGRSRNRGW